MKTMVMAMRRWICLDGAGRPIYTRQVLAVVNIHKNADRYLAEIETKVFGVTFIMENIQVFSVTLHNGKQRCSYRCYIHDN